MGSFFGKGKNKAKDADKAADKGAATATTGKAESKTISAGQNTRASRRVVTGGNSGVKPGLGKTASVTRPGAAKPPGGTSVMAKPKPQPTSASDLVQLPGDLMERPDTKAPITSSNAPQFTGSLVDAPRPAGPCRTGDVALTEFLVNKAKLITPEQATQAADKAKAEDLPLDAAAVALKLFTEEQLVNALTGECWVPHLKVDKYEIRKKALDTVGREDAVHFSVFPVDKLGSLLTLAMVNPLDAETIRVLESKTGLDIKRVVATRSEIQQGVEKYYSGQVVAKDTSISFTADATQETKSVVQLLGNVQAADSSPATTTALPTEVTEIQDIDDLLSADEVIAPAIIEPVKAEAPPALASDAIEVSDPLMPDSPALEARTPAKPDTAEFGFDDADTQSVPPPLVPPKTTRVVAAPEFELDDTDALSPSIKPATDTRSSPKLIPDAPLPPPRTAAPAAPAAKAPVTASIARPVSSTSRQPGSTSNLFPARTSTGRVANPKIINLIPVLEEEFQHAITHGKAHVFEKWVGLQSRNRIINAVAVDAEFSTLLEGVYDSPRRVG